MLSIQNLTHRYPNGTLALDAVSLEIPKGVYGLLGPNGAGKSTLMRSIATLQIPAQGSIRFEDIEVTREPERLRRVLGYLPQDFGVYPHVTPLQLLDHLAVLKGISTRADRKQMVETLLQQVNLWDARKKPIISFSGGMRQRFGIAQALIGSPRIVIVDEPTAGLDPEERNRFNNLLAEIGENVVVILSTHIVDDVADLCARMAVIVRGKIVREGVPHELMRELSGRVFRRTIERAELAAFRRDFSVISTRLREGRTVIHVLADAQPEPAFSEVSPGLEDVYFATLHSASSASPAA
jgi:ABC-type multidrug transport system ATPase subunit